MRNRVHSEIEATIAMLLGNWLEDQPQPPGQGPQRRGGFRLRRDPETFVGIDVADVSAEMVAATDPTVGILRRPPVLAVEILSPSDQYGDVAEKVELYLEVGPSSGWSTRDSAASASTGRAGVESFNETQELSGEPELPGFRVRVAEFFLVTRRRSRGPSIIRSNLALMRRARSSLRMG